MEVLAKRGIVFGGSTVIYIAKEGRLYKYDSWFGSINTLVIQMQRLANPLVSLKSEEAIMEFL